MNPEVKTDQVCTTAAAELTRVCDEYEHIAPSLGRAERFRQANLIRAVRGDLHSALVECHGGDESKALDDTRFNDQFVRARLLIESIQ